MEDCTKLGETFQVSGEPNCVYQLNKNLTFRLNVIHIQYEMQMKVRFYSLDQCLPFETIPRPISCSGNYTVCSVFGAGETGPQRRAGRSPTAELAVTVSAEWMTLNGLEGQWPWPPAACGRDYTPDRLPFWVTFKSYYLHHIHQPEEILVCGFALEECPRSHWSEIVSLNLNYES